MRVSPRLYRLTRAIYYRELSLNTLKTECCKIFIEGRGHLNFGGLGNSDFFWLKESKIEPEKIAYVYKTNIDKSLLDQNNVHSVPRYVGLSQKFELKERNKKTNRNYPNCVEHNNINRLKKRYISDKNYWYAFLKSHNIKIHLTWYDNNADHMAIADAMQELNGVATMWQTSFYGFKNYECKTSTDVMFFYSKFDSDVNISLGSKNKYNIITGVYNTDNKLLLKKEASKIKNKLKQFGAKKIVCVLDENSTADNRWHTGHELQSENYAHILEKVLEVPWLGVIFKPKKADTLRQRLGSINITLKKAEKTGRCIVLEQTGKQSSAVPAILGGLASDVTIHGHLCAGSAALECVLSGVPTIMVDREGSPNSKLSELPKGSVVFNNWQDAINALMDYFQKDNRDKTFGNWSKIIGEFDPFNDNKASQRMGSYLNNLLCGLQKGIDREVIMADVAKQYADKWGDDKVIQNY